MAEVVMYTTRSCPYCRAAKALLVRKGVAFKEIDVGGDAEGRKKMIERAQGRSTVPQIFIGATHVGGYDDLYALDRAGGIDPLLNGAQGQPA
jgi:glutaredoxin 3